MFAAKESQTTQQFSARGSSYLDDMAPLQHGHYYGLPTLISDAAFRGRHTSDSHCLITSQQNTVGEGVLKMAHPNCDTPRPIGGNLYLNGAQCAFPNSNRITGFTDKTINASGIPQKRFLIFDRSRNQTRLFFSPSFCPQDPFLASKAPDYANGPSKETAVEKDLEEHWDENDLTEGEDEMREDTEEINALLYSDSDDEDDSDDEVTSTGYSPCIAKEVEYSNGFPKRQKLIDGRYKRSSSSSSPHAEIPFSQPITHCFEDDVQSSCAGNANTNSPANDGVLYKREKKVRIRQALTALSSIIPGLCSNNDPLSIIDEAIVHLKSMRAEALQESYPEHNESTTSSNGVQQNH